MKHDNELPEGFAICVLLVAPVLAAVVGSLAWVVLR
jgi:hypothetical protein